jgi:hypothetical protein
VPKMETLRSWDIRGLNVRLNRVFELNRLPYAGYPGDDCCNTLVFIFRSTMSMEFRHVISVDKTDAKF